MTCKSIHLLFGVLCLVLCAQSVQAQITSTLDETLIPPPGISYQIGPGAGNNENWTYRYGVKLSVFGNTYRNFEIMNTQKHGSSTLALRTYDGGPSAWTGWREFLFRDYNDYLIFPVKSFYYKEQTNFNGDFLLTSSNVGIKGNYGASISFSKITGGTNKRAAIVSKQTSTDVDVVGLAFFTHTGTGADDLIERMVLLGNGNVGIGTENPDHKLDVKGTIHSEEVKVDLSVPAPDYVFSPNYALTTLEETASYIKENHHLPEVPSAKEMETNGINLGEMDMLLLKKIEELTLYMIEMNKALKEMKVVNEKQEEELHLLRRNK